jgi:hypothetical protein
MRPDTVLAAIEQKIVQTLNDRTFNTAWPCEATHAIVDVNAGYVMFFTSEESMLFWSSLMGWQRPCHLFYAWDWGPCLIP